MAEKLEQRSRQTILLLKGLPCCGKSTLADALSQTTGWPVIDKDDGRDCLSVLTGPHDSELNALSYDIMMHFAARQVRNGLSVIVDCPLSRREIAQRFCVLAEQHQARLAIVECVLEDEACWQDRLAARSKKIAGTEQSHKPDTWEALQRLIEGYKESHLWAQSPQSALTFNYDYLQISMLDASKAAQTLQTWILRKGLHVQPLSLCQTKKILPQGHRMNEQTNDTEKIDMALEYLEALKLAER